MSTRLQIRNALQRRITTRSDLVNSDFDKWIDDGLLDLATRRVQLRSLEGAAIAGPSLTAGVYSYAIPTTTPATIFALMAVWVYASSATAGVILKPWDGTFQTMLDSLANSQGQAGARPAYYMLHGTSFFVYPVPETTYSSLLLPYYRPFLDTGDSSVPTIEPEWHYAIELLAAEHAWRDLGDEERAAAAEAEFGAWLAMRDTPLRAAKRYDPRNIMAKPHPSARNPRTGV